MHFKGSFEVILKLLQISLQATKAKAREQKRRLATNFYNIFFSGLPEIRIYTNKYKALLVNTYLLRVYWSVHCILFYMQVYTPRKHAQQWGSR